MVFEPSRLALLRQRIKAACDKSGRISEDVSLLVATKYADKGQMNHIIEAGVSIIGENRVQAALEKFTELKPVTKHLIGPLQSNKVKKAVELFDLIESVDDLEVARKIDLESSRIGKKMPVFVEINIAEDPHKHGIVAQNLVEFLENLQSFQFLAVKGLMTVVPYFENNEQSRPYFKKMKVLFDLAKQTFPSLEVLSMGMSHDFEIAIEEGATEIRIGSYLFS